MKDILKNGGKLFLKTIVINLMCFFVVVSFSVISTAIFTENIGYTAYGVTESALENEENPQNEELYTHYFADGEDTKKAEYEAKGYKVNTDATIRSSLSGKGEAFFLIMSAVFSTLLTVAFIYPNLWQDGTRDSNLIKFKHKKEDKLRGFKIGIVAVIPNYLLLITLAVLKSSVMSSFPVAFYKFLNSAFYSIIEVISAGAATLSELSILQIILLLLLPLFIPLISGTAYLLGLNNISIGEKLVYKKKKIGE